jgi:transcriptional repressor NrdR
MEHSEHHERMSQRPLEAVSIFDGTTSTGLGKATTLVLESAPFMKCPYCGDLENKVIDSRLSQGGEVTRRRRECARCQRRYTTYERVEEALPWVVKRDGRREPFDHGKFVSGIKKACEKRPVSLATIESMAESIERELNESGAKEVASTAIGEKVMERLRGIDEVAYVRFASVYRSFRDADEFMAELAALLRERGEKT